MAEDGRPERIGEPSCRDPGKLVRRLQGLLQDSDGVLRRAKTRGKPLEMPDSEPKGPLVIDLWGDGITR